MAQMVPKRHLKMFLTKLTVISLFLPAILDLGTLALDINQRHNKQPPLENNKLINHPPKKPETRTYRDIHRQRPNEEHYKLELNDMDKDIVNPQVNHLPLSDNIRLLRMAS